MILGVNVDHVATVREARKEAEPDPEKAAALAIRGGADGITIHLKNRTESRNGCYKGNDRYCIKGQA
jgi:pyridoxine 5'-phosphate synthase PdxJ